MTNEYIHLIIDGEICTDDKGKLKEIAATVSRSKSLTGGEVTTEIVVMLTSPFFIKAFKDVVISLIQSKRSVTLKTKELNITGISEAEAIKIINSIKTDKE